MDGGEGLANIAIHSFQLTNQIRNEYHFLPGRKLYSFFVALLGAVSSPQNSHIVVVDIAAELEAVYTRGWRQRPANRNAVYFIIIH